MCPFYQYIRGVITLVKCVRIVWAQWFRFPRDEWQSSTEWSEWRMYMRWSWMSCNESSCIPLPLWLCAASTKTPNRSERDDNRSLFIQQITIQSVPIFFDCKTKDTNDSMCCWVQYAAWIDFGIFVWEYWRKIIINPAPQMNTGHQVLRISGQKIAIL